MSVLERLAELAPERIRPLRRSEFESLVAQGRFEGERVELIEGVLVEMTPQAPGHAACVQRLTRVLSRMLTGRADVRVQLPLAVSDDSLPEPDIAVVPVADFDDRHPTSALLVVEVAGTSLRKDRLVKADLYARAGVPEYWLVNLLDRHIEVHTGPSASAYTGVAESAVGTSIRLIAFADVEVAVSDILR